MMFKKPHIIAFSIISMIIMAYGFAWPFRISGDCMEPAIKDGQLCFLNRALPYLRHYQTDDIILFKHEGKVWISRILGLANSTIQIVPDNILADVNAPNNAEITRNWSHWNQGTYAINEPFHVPLNHVFVLSDNLSAQHDDSRVFGPISHESILGIVC